MITIRSDLKVLVAAQPVDFRKGMDALAGLVAECLSENPYAGTIFVFRSTLWSVWSAPPASRAPAVGAAFC